MKARTRIIAASHRARASRRQMRVWADAQAPIAVRPTTEPTDAEPAQFDMLDQAEHQGSDDQDRRR